MAFCAAAASVALVACAGAAPEPTPAPAPARSSMPECDAAGIDSRRGREGTCITGEVVRTVVNRHKRLVIPGDVAVEIERVATRRRRGERLVMVTLSVKNLSRSRLRWPTARGQLALFIGDRLVAQDPRSAAAAASVRPGATRRIVAGWRLRPPLASALFARGSAVVIVPPQEARLGARTVDDALRIGIVRLWR